jgi:hypothetical protein
VLDEGTTHRTAHDQRHDDTAHDTTRASMSTELWSLRWVHDERHPEAGLQERGARWHCREGARHKHDTRSSADTCAHAGLLERRIGGTRAGRPLVDAHGREPDRHPGPGRRQALRQPHACLHLRCRQGIVCARAAMRVSCACVYPCAVVSTSRVLFLG